MGRFLNADAFTSTGQGLTGNNMFAYCLNNPIVHHDYNGMYTYGISIGGNITAGIGVSIGIGVFWDSNGKCEIQWSYSVPGIDNTVTVGALDVGIGLSLQVTDRSSIYDLHGPATYLGASGGPLWYVGGDVISFSDASDLENAKANGLQFTAGVGLGVDVHVTESYTKPIKPQKTTTKPTQRSIYIHPRHTHVFLRKLLIT